MISVSLDEFGNNLWTLAAASGASLILNRLINMLYGWQQEDLDRVLHYKTKHREQACMQIVENAKTNLESTANEKQSQSEALEKLKQHMDSPPSDILNADTFLQTLKKHLDTTLQEASLLKSSPAKNILFRLRRRLFRTELNWYSNSLADLVSKNFPPSNMIVFKLIELETICHDEFHCSHANESFLKCIYTRVGKSPATVLARSLAEESYPPSKMSKLKSFFLGFAAFCFSLSLLSLDVFSDIKLVSNRYQDYIDNATFNCAKNVTDENKNRFSNLGSILYNPVNILLFTNDLHSMFWATLIALLLPFFGYLVSWIKDNSLGFTSLRREVS